ncbi:MULTISPECIES: TIGR02680 family protein [unclassified Cryobacterium]|uniref:TIGR02680 family protein n=1 Tax=unclassified Cryobacterium TaxID=2649013 RepID=UPI002AB4D0D3|nr:MULTISPECIES: TIGR02680 family protein [unclassified Cryobacterium]MDY7541148.1 TIGR02680 family protein [Cryobacterium sp. 5B3]MEA9998898.1 TIGR02680 family protein [Cryobacterium sp. RTS3]MEB0265759.1 TIGR02680 family protein [Cryobacterium sp. 10I5]MEB0274281.1 TIGR02680 family protein [Cryobacterium sp. 5B3]
MTLDTVAPFRSDSQPVPTSVRWQPQRLGLVDLFYYDNEEFPFVDGRLLLRGNNGAGKSKVLALTLPFLLDGDLSPQRVEPDGDRQKRMEWNLLLGDEHPNGERLGYSWLEFGRIDEAGQAQYVTIGAGLKAARGRGITRHWFFVTDQRVGETLDLIDASRLALGRDRLAEALGDRGRVYDTKGEYRQAVDAKLFGLGERRYAELIELLLQIRAPQLSKKPSEAALSEALTRALTPVSDDVIKSVADGLRSLDEERDEVQQLAAAQKAVHGFLQHYRAYAQVMLKRQAVGPRREQSDFDKYGRAILEVTAELERLRESLNANAAATAERRTEHGALEAEQEALRDSVHAESERLLHMADAAATAAGERAALAEAGLQRADAALTRADTEAADDRAEFVAGATQFRAASASAVAAAVDAGIEHDPAGLGIVPDETGRPFERGGRGGDASGGFDGFEAAFQRERTAAAARVTRLRESLDRVSALIAVLEQAEARLGAANLREAETETRLAEATDERAATDAAVEVAVDAYVSEVDIVLAALTELAVSDDAFGAFTDWVRLRTGENPASTALRWDAQRLQGELERRRADLRHRLGDLATRHSALLAEISGLEQGESVEPTLPHTRTAPAGGSLPLWRAVSFSDGVSAEHRAGLEAALEGSGLLTALVLPDGDLRQPGDGQLLLHGALTGTSAGTLASVLVAEPPAGSAVTAETIEAVLRGIRLGDDSSPGDADSDSRSDAASSSPRGIGDDSPAVWVSLTGRYRLGSAFGAWSVDTARFIGESARETARTHRLREARAELDTISAEQEGLTIDLDEIAARSAVIEREQAAVPYPTALETADRSAERAADHVAQRTSEREETRVRSAGARRELAEAEAELAADAATLHLPTGPDAIRGLGSALSEYERQVTALWHAAERWASAGRRLGRAETRLTAARDERDRTLAEVGSAADERTRTGSYLETLRQQLGADVRGYRERVAAVAAELKSISAALGRLGESARRDGEKQAGLGERLRGIRADQDRVAANRVAAVAALQRTTALGLVQVADVAALAVVEPDAGGDTDWTVTRGVQFARAIEAALPELDATDEKYTRLQSQVFTEFADLQRSLGRHGHEAAYYPNDDGVRVVVTFRGREMLLVELAEQLGGQIEQHLRLLSAKEREIIQSHLVTEVGAQLSELIGEADRQIVQLNEELRARPTTTGMILRVLWKPRPDGPAGLTEARRLLATTADVWDESDRVALGGFLQARIAEVRDADEAGNWYDHLGEALDYRRWHRFTIERQQGGVWKSATGPASGGERVLAASIPLFAAASSHYRTATNPYAPRMIMLDEAFAGVDDNSRASCLGLLAEFDLDVVMTSEREWGCYVEVPGLGISQLTRFDGTDAVHVQRWQWDGKRRTAVVDAGVAAAEAEAGGLW